MNSIYDITKTWNNKKLISDLAEENSNRCFYCNTPFSPNIRAKRATVDHFFPKGRKGSNGLENLRSCCGRCNSWKSHFSMSEWVDRMQEENKNYAKAIKENNEILKECLKINTLTGKKIS
jgi:5-methylcytosine-specific restriction endonuclease McrA